MHDCLITEGGGWAVDFIGRVEHIDADLQAMLEEIERRRPAEAPPVRRARLLPCPWWEGECWASAAGLRAAQRAMPLLRC